MKPADFGSLTNDIVRPNMEKHLLPLLAYRGFLGMGRVERLWNFVITCMHSEVESASEAVKLSHNPDFAHLCSTTNRVQNGSLYGFLGRLIDNQNVTDNIPGLTKYVRDIQSFKFTPMSVPLYTNSFRKRPYADWRIVGFSPEHLAAKASRRTARMAETARRKAERVRSSEPREQLAYPYMIHRPKNGDDEKWLLLKVHRAVPRHLPEWIRADICQDLIVAVLSGDIQRTDLRNSMRSYMGKVLKMHPWKYGPLSLDAPLFDEGDTTLGDRITEEDYRERLGWT